MKTHIILFALFALVGCSDRFAVVDGLGGDGGSLPAMGGSSDEQGEEETEEETNDGGTSAGGSVVDVSTGGSPMSGGSSSGGAPGGSGGSGTGGAAPKPPYDPECGVFRCGAVTATGEADTAYCFSVQPNDSTEGNFSGSGCTVTHDGELFDSFSNGVPSGKLLVWGCSSAFWFNCY